MSLQHTLHRNQGRSLDSLSMQGCFRGIAAGDQRGFPFKGQKPGSSASPEGFGCAATPSDGTSHLSVRTAETVAALAAVFAEDSNPLGFRDAFWARMDKSLRLTGHLSSAPIDLVVRKLAFGASLAIPGDSYSDRGAAIRAAVLGVQFARIPAKLREFILLSTKLSEWRPRALAPALALGAAAAVASEQNLRVPELAFSALQRKLAELAPVEEQPHGLLENLLCGVEENLSVAEFAQQYAPSTGISVASRMHVQLALFAWIRHSDDFAEGVDAVIRCGGDTDASAALTGALIGCSTGPSGIPSGWLDSKMDWSIASHPFLRAAQPAAPVTLPPDSLTGIRWFLRNNPLIRERASARFIAKTLELL